VSEAEGLTQRDGGRLGPVVVGAVMVLVGLVLFWQTLEIRGEGFDPQGPRFFPFVVVLLWLLVSVLYLVRHLLALARGHHGMPSEAYQHTVSVLLLVVLLVAYTFALDPVGYWIATSVFFVVAARLLGSRHLARDCTVGILLSLGVYLAFTRALGVRLPEGILGF
jgi:putative tricarboxylic transport membrane protein